MTEDEYLQKIKKHSDFIKKYNKESNRTLLIINTNDTKGGVDLDLDLVFVNGYLVRIHDTLRECFADAHKYAEEYGFTLSEVSYKSMAAEDENAIKAGLVIENLNSLNGKYID